MSNFPFEFSTDISLALNKGRSFCNGTYAHVTWDSVVNVFHYKQTMLNDQYKHKFGCIRRRTVSRLSVTQGHVSKRTIIEYLLLGKCST